MAPNPARTAASGLTKGQDTRQRILQQALLVATRHGLSGLSLGELAADLGLSKSGLFAHFKSKERLQLDVLEQAAVQFGQEVLVPAFSLPRGLPRLRAMFNNWLDWIVASDLRSGCLFFAEVAAWDDQAGPVRDSLVQWFQELHATLRKAAQLAIEAGHLRPDVDLDQFASELHGIVLKFHLDSRLLRSAQATARAQQSFERLLSYAAA
jgi:AcrR family transcriptional regulator